MGRFGLNGRTALVLDGESVFATDVVRGLGAAGMRSHVLSTDALAPSRGSRHALSCHVSPYSSDDAFLERTAAAVTRTGADVLVGVNVPTIARAVRLSASLQRIAPCLPLPPPGPFAASLDKLAFARLVGTHGIAHPTTVSCTPPAAEAFAAEHGLPVLAKPVEGAFGRGIRKFDDLGLLKAFARSPTVAATPYLLQQFVAGSDVDCSVLCRDGDVLAYTVQRPLPSSTRTFSAPDAIEMVDDPRVITLVRALMKALQWHGVAHVDLRYDEQRTHLYVLELNPRFWGSLQGSLRAGVNFPALAAQVALGVPVSTSAARPCTFVSGSGAVRIWSDRVVRRGATRLRYADTMWATIQPDPGPSLYELARTVRGLLTRRRNG